MLLPKLWTISDVDEDQLELAGGEDVGQAGATDIPPAIPDLRRHLELTGLVRAYLAADPDSATPDTPEHAYRLAVALAKLIDEIQMHGLEPSALAALVPETYATHWGRTLDFLKIVTEAWPARLTELEATDPVTRRDALMRAEAAALIATPPESPVIIAGSTGSVPATADLMRAVLTLPQGALVLPGLDLDSGEDEWTAVGDDPTHPQHGLHVLLSSLGLARDEVRPWSSAPGAERVGGRAALIREVMRPAATTDSWRGLAADAGPALRGAVDGITRIDAATPREEAGAIAMLMREVLETPGKTAALVTPDRGLARRVAVELKRWEIRNGDGLRLEVNDSGGAPLANSASGVFLRLLAQTMVDCAPVPLLALLRHPLSGLGQDPLDLDERVRHLERSVLRGPRPAPGLAALRRAAERSTGFADPDLIDRLASALGPLEAALGARDIAVAEILEIHLRAAEALAETRDTHGSLMLWVGEAGEALARLSNEVMDAASGLATIRGVEWPGLFDALLEGRVVRPRYGSHPRLQILGTLEARLLAFDRVILAGLNEGTWPANPPADPWMSRPMRRDFGMPSIDLAIGKAAHDVAMALGGAEVFLTRSERVEGSPTIPSRWLLRLDTVAKALAVEDRVRADPTAGAWHAALDAPDRVEPGRPPEPRPRLDQRPRRLSVTRIDTWLRDPYSIYARHILGLEVLDGIDDPVGAIDRGNAVHEALDRFVRAHPRDLPPDPLRALIRFGEASFAPLIDRPAVWAFWWPRFLQVAEWFIAVERDRRKSLSFSATEQRGEITLDGPGGPFTLYGIADRIDRNGDGTYAVIDYKTGSSPTIGELRAGKAPQLPLEALMLERGGFPDLPVARVTALEYWRVGGGSPPGRIDPETATVAALIAGAEDGLRQLITAFDDPDTPYHAEPDPRRALRFKDYGHLARTGEWAAEEEGEA
jgi:ATP-dependent helicase/nuclease subunit B